MKRFALLLVLLPALVLGASCATTSPLATPAKDWGKLAGVWEEEWPGAATKDRYRIAVSGETVAITAVANPEKQQIRNVAFQYKRLSFFLDLDGGAVYYDLMLVSDGLLAGKVTGGKRNFDEMVRWYKVE
jgi:hypothetical protein